MLQQLKPHLTEYLYTIPSFSSLYHQNLKKRQQRDKSLNTLQVMAVDQESGDATFATVVVEVLSEGQLSKDTLSHLLYWSLI